MHGRLAAVSLAARKVFYYGENLRRDEPDAADPLPLIPGEGRLSVSADPESRQLWLHRDGSSVAVAMHNDERGSGAHAALHRGPEQRRLLDPAELLRQPHRRAGDGQRGLGQTRLRLR